MAWNSSLAIAVCLILCNVSLGVDPTSKDHTAKTNPSDRVEWGDEYNEQVRESIIKEFERLESRIDELEDQLADRSQQTQFLVPPSDAASNPYATPVPRYPTPSFQNKPQEPAPTPPIPSSNPKSWQRFNFNGQWFYIVPVGDIPAPAAPTAQ